ncbi:helix-turn-helix domain-containing protein [Micromonospora sp. RTGN7]|uniref:helix-turn-helix domain-containing protein n=1 Tax=Micromonospora sp. RTGN7 TaxID=3016526 RepID=UPI0029FF364F|nr:helix-turn-helix domain-containing protein [Micromonospora sp. RTGN7]
MDSSDLLPVGRRVAYWRRRRRMSQQVFADRLGKSKSWVDKIERGVRSLDKVSTLRDIAAVLRIDTAVLLGRDVQPVVVVERVQGVERIRAALSTYEIAVGRPAAHPLVLPADPVGPGCRARVGDVPACPVPAGRSGGPGSAGRRAAGRRR